jgi:hypothetical protein
MNNIGQHTIKDCPAGCVVRRGGDIIIDELKHESYVPPAPVHRAGKYEMSKHVRNTAVICTRCGLRGPVKDGEEQAVDAWNTMPRFGQLDLLPEPEDAETEA